MSSIDEQLKDRLNEFVRVWIEMSLANGETFDEWFDEYFSDRSVIIRSSGNPLPRELWKKMISSADVVYSEEDNNKLVSIDTCEVYANKMAATTTFTMDIYFSYKGTQNADRAKISLSWAKNEEGKWKIMLFHRSTGQEIPKDE